MEKYNQEQEMLNQLERIAVSSEVSAYDEAIKNNNEILLRLKESRKSVEDEALRIVDSMSVAYDQKTESINSLRQWRKTIESESALCQRAINLLMANVTSEKTNQLRDIVDLLERLNKIDPNIILGKLFSDNGEVQ